MKRIISVLAAAAAGLSCAEPEIVLVYQTVALDTRDIVVSAQAAGVIEPDTTVEVKSKASGEILQIDVGTGERVARGTMLVRIDRRVPTNSLAQSEAALEVAQARLTNADAQKRRSEALYETASITTTEYEAAILGYANAKAVLIQAEVDVENDRIAMADTDILAPITGTIISKNVERGQVISSPTRDVSGGTVLLTMADLTMVQVRTLVDETDIGKIRQGLSATVTVASYPNQPFEGEVLKIEPMAVTQQNVTMFPVLIQIENTEGLLRPGMNAEVEIGIGRREGVLAIPNSALRTERDVYSAAEVLGLTADDVRTQLAADPEPTPQGQEDPATVSDGTARGETVTLPNGAEVELPEGVTAAQFQAIANKRRSGGELTPDERAVMQQAFQSMQGPGGGSGPTDRGSEGPSAGGGAGSTSDFLVFVLRGGAPMVLKITTGLTDLDYSEVLEGLSEADSVLVLPNIS
jgi:HlyD family secretion protein